ncbi:hypothetical protein J7923_13285 [Vibrio parahaemolyticus]|uniref:hypothetical protein n=1 Tax=Vibrio parahaemolyticus TaxID=670 RepID=UPI00193F74C6|nr:hypothetical protein [Vibrio parahaemolyticus]MBM5438435.1 hypothetical protein [Vibrio parahaemolyticus]MCF9749884.1 hypothetical protein [Vibrio parahaemolyticus]MCF9759478.1 hypothetical protein [Vibrio parahaemolyticus]MCF9784185.1 hypothetical protein [Vibrio parahaemolyticus]
MNREEYTQLMIDKSKSLARDDMNVVDRIVNKINGKKIRTNEEFADLLIEECFKQDGIRPEFFLDTTQTASQQVLNTIEKQEAFAKRMVEFQQAEAVVHKMMISGNIQELQADGTISLYKESMKFNPKNIDSYYVDYVKRISNENEFVVSEAPKPIEYTDKFTLFSQEPIKNEQSALIKTADLEQPKIVNSSETKIKETVPQDVDVPEVEYPIQKSDKTVKSYQDFIDELLEKYESNYSVEKLGKTGLKKRLFNAETGGSITIEKSIFGSTTLTAGTGTKAVDLKMLFMNKKSKTLTQVPTPETEEDFLNMIEAWKLLRSDGFDLNTIKLHEEGIPQRYHDALAELTRPSFVMNGEELNNDVEEPAKPENSFVVVDDNPFENEGETPENPKNEGDVPQEPKHQEKQEQVDDNPFSNDGETPEQPKNEGDVPQEPKHQEKQEQQVDDNPFEGENAVKAEQAQEPENQIVDDNPFEGENAVNEPEQPDQQSDELDIDFGDLEFDDEDEAKNKANQEKDFDPDFDDALADAVNGIDPNSDEAVEQRAVNELQIETGTNPKNSQKTHQQQAKKAKLR